MIFSLKFSQQKSFCGKVVSASQVRVATGVREFVEERKGLVASGVGQLIIFLWWCKGSRIPKS